MKKMMLCLIFLLVCSVGAVADMSVSLEQELTNRNLLDAMKGTVYENYTLYQPVAREDYNYQISKETLKNYDLFPVIAVGEDEVALVILERNGNGWEIKCKNEKALCRNGFSIVGFSIDEEYSNKDDRTRVYFRFAEDNEEAPMTFELLLLMSKQYQNHFEQITLTPKKEQDYLFADYGSLGFVNGHGMRYSYTYADSQNRFDYYIDNYAKEICGTVEEFDLSQVPFTLFDAMKEYTVHGKQDKSYSRIPIKEYPDWNSVTLIEVESGERIMGEQSARGFNYREWILVSVDKQLGYLHKSFVDLDL